MSKMDMYFVSEDLRNPRLVQNAKIIELKRHFPAPTPDPNSFSSFFLKEVRI